MSKCTGDILVFISSVEKEKLKRNSKRNNTNHFCIKPQNTSKQYD